MPLSLLFSRAISRSLSHPSLHYGPENIQNVCVFASIPLLYTRVPANKIFMIHIPMLTLICVPIFAYDPIPVTHAHMQISVGYLHTTVGDHA